MLRKRYGLNLREQNIIYEIFDDVEEDADVNVIHKIALRVIENKFDGIIVVGGGSPICSAKGAALAATNKVDDIRSVFGNNRSFFRLELHA